MNLKKNNSYILNAQKALANYLQKPQASISCTLLHGGSEDDKVVKCTSATTNYVIKIFKSSESGSNEIAWTQHASNLGIGPKLFFADPKGNYMITAFARGETLVPAVANKPAVLKRIAENLYALHQSTITFGKTSKFFDRIDTKYKKLQCSGVLKDLLEQGMKRVTTIRKLLRRVKMPLVPCHNDLNWGNIFVEKNHVTFIDWGDAALSDPLYDIAAFLVLNVIDVDHEETFLEGYDKKFLELPMQVHLHLYKQIVHVEFALNLLLGVQHQRKELLHVDQSSKVNTLAYYLTKLAERTTKIDAHFLYEMAVASLNEID